MILDGNDYASLFFAFQDEKLSTKIKRGAKTSLQIANNVKLQP